MHPSLQNVIIQTLHPYRWRITEVQGVNRCAIRTAHGETLQMVVNLSESQTSGRLRIACCVDGAGEHIEDLVQLNPDISITAKEHHVYATIQFYDLATLRTRLRSLMLLMGTILMSTYQSSNSFQSGTLASG